MITLDITNNLYILLILFALVLVPHKLVRQDSNKCQNISKGISISILNKDY